MKKSYFLLILCFVLQSCFYPQSDDDVELFLGNFKPVIMNRTEFETTLNYETIARPIENSGKIYVKGNYIFVNEVNKGFHIIDNSDPSNPSNVGFLKVLGSSDLSIRSEVFYANNATDLIAFKINESTQSINITKRLPNVFPQIWSPEGMTHYDLQENEIIVDWIPLD